MGARTLKTGQSRFFVGYKKHTFRLWLRRYERGVLLVPLVSWAAPANLGEGCLLRPSVAHCWRRWQWRPDFIVGDMGYIDATTKRTVREGWQVAVITRLKENMLRSLRSKRQRRRAVDTANPCSGWGMKPATNSIGLACRNRPSVALCAGKLPLVPANLGLRPRHMRRCSDSCL